VSTKSKSEIFLAAGLDKLGKSVSCVVARASEAIHELYPEEWIASSLCSSQ
jgi:hypothetical protein